MAYHFLFRFTDRISVSKTHARKPGGVYAAGVSIGFNTGKCGGN